VRDAGSSVNGFVRVKLNNNINYSPYISRISRYPRDALMSIDHAGVHKQRVAENLLYQLRNGKPFDQRTKIFSCINVVTTTSPTIVITLCHHSASIAENSDWRIVHAQQISRRWWRSVAKFWRGQRPAPNFITGVRHNFLVLYTRPTTIFSLNRY